MSLLVQFKMVTRRAESVEVRGMREDFERREKQALRTSKVYMDVTKHKKAQISEAEKRATKGSGESYVDSDRRIAVGLGRGCVHAAESSD